MAVCFNKLNKGVDKVPSVANKRLLRKKIKKHMLTSIQKSKTIRTRGSVLWRELNTSEGQQNLSWNSWKSLTAASIVMVEIRVIESL